MAENKPVALIVVFGNVDQSPRMLNHANSLAENNFSVKIIGYAGKEKISNPSIQVIPISSWTLPTLPVIPSLIHKILALVYAIFFRSIVYLWLGIFGVGKPELILVQNPPSLPTLLISPILARYHRAKYIIDWHNLGYTVLSLSFGKNSPIVRFSKWSENAFLLHILKMLLGLNYDWRNSATIILP